MLYDSLLVDMLSLFHSAHKKSIEKLCSPCLGLFHVFRIQVIFLGPSEEEVPIRPGPDSAIAVRASAVNSEHLSESVSSTWQDDRAADSTCLTQGLR